MSHVTIIIRNTKFHELVTRRLS